MKKRALLGIAVFLVAGLLPPRTAFSQCRPTIPPIRNIAIKVLITINLHYTAKDESSARSDGHQTILDKLNSLGESDENTFRDIEGEEQNLTFIFDVYNDGQDHFTGSLELRGWGWGHISTFNRTSNPYATPSRLLEDLVDDAYVFVHLGWHEIRAECTGQPGAPEVR